MNDKTPTLNVDYADWLQIFRGVTTATNERTLLSGNIPLSGTGNSAPVISYENGRAVASALVLANMNSLPLDWAARCSMGGVNMNFFIVKQLPVLPPETYLEKPHPDQNTFAELIVPRVLELSYTASDLQGFAHDLGYHAPPFPWNDQTRHCIQCELDAIFAHMYRLERLDLEWILDAPSPSSSFPVLKRKEEQEFDEYRTKRYILHAFDQIMNGEEPKLNPEPKLAEQSSATPTRG